MGCGLHGGDHDRRSSHITVRRALVASALLLLAACATISSLRGNKGWYWTATSPNGGEPAVIGPYNSEYGCKDWLGSALFLHGPLCHDHPNDANCAPIGNGYAYVVGTPYPAPRQIPSATCFQCAGNCKVPSGYKGLVYPASGSVQVVGCGKFKKSTEMKGSGCFFVGDTGE